jgi:hypothetical protein
MNTTLTLSGALRHSEGPNQDRRSRRLCAAQQDKNSGFSCFCHNELAEQRPDVRKTQAAYLEPGSVVSPFLFFNPQNQEVSRA